MKIHIIGCSGAGKSYLAEKLAKKYGIPHFDLDDLQWDHQADSYGVRTPVEKRNEMLSEILQKEDWIVEGVYYGWVGESFDKADQIYVMDVPARVYKYRIIRRFVRRKIGLEKGKKESLKSLHDLLKWTETFQTKNRKEIESILGRYEHKVKYIVSTKEVDEIIHL